MNTDQFKSRLAEEKAKLEAELASVGRKNPSNPADWEPVPQDTELNADPNDVATEISGYEDNAGIVKELEVRYNDVLAALKRIEDGSYGVCEAGGEPIEEARLDADPAARTCIAHK
jgi:RNA polymerase-binding transcription factor DksA